MFIRIRRTFEDTEEATIDKNPPPKTIVELWLLNISSVGPVESFRKQVDGKCYCYFRTAKGQDSLGIELGNTFEEIDKKLVEISELSIF